MRRADDYGIALFVGKRRQIYQNEWSEREKKENLNPSTLPSTIFCAEDRGNSLHTDSRPMRAISVDLKLTIFGGSSLSGEERRRGKNKADEAGVAGKSDQ